MLGRDGPANYHRIYLTHSECYVGTCMENTARYNECIAADGKDILSLEVDFPAFLMAGGLTVGSEGYPPVDRTVRATIEAADVGERALRLLLTH